MKVRESERDEALGGREVADEWLIQWGLAQPSDRSVTSRDEAVPDVGAILGAPSGRYERPDPETRLLNASRVHAARQALVDQGTYTVKEIAQTVGRTVNTVHKQIQRARKRSELLTVAVNGETHIPEVLFDDGLDVRREWQPVISVLRDVGIGDWGIWRWIAQPNAGLSGEIAAEVIRTDPERVYSAARRRASQAEA